MDQQLSQLVIRSIDGQPMQMNVSRFSWQQLAAANHQHELVPNKEYFHMHMDVAHMGVGGDDSWSPTVHEQYLVRPRMYKMALLLHGL
jgi:beta-galactosidase